MGKRCHALLVTLICVAAFGVAWKVPGLSARDFYPPGDLVDGCDCGDYRVNLYRRNDETTLEAIQGRLPSGFANFLECLDERRPWSGFEILKRGRRVFSSYGDGFGFEFARIGAGGKVTGRDIIGDGTPKIALTDSLGRQGGGTIRIFECGGRFRKIVEIESWGMFPVLRDFDGDGIPELIVSDNAFYHWPVCQDGEPMPEVILRWQNGKYVPAKDLMLKPVSSVESIMALAADIRASPEWESGFPPEALWTNAVALMYNGHEALDWDFMRTAWKPGFPKDGAVSHEDIVGFLTGRLEESLYWRDLKSDSGTNLTTRIVVR